MLTKVKIAAPLPPGMVSGVQHATIKETSVRDESLAPETTRLCAALHHIGDSAILFPRAGDRFAPVA